MSERWWHIDDGLGDPQACYWTEKEHVAGMARAAGSKVVEYVPAEPPEPVSRLTVIEHWAGLEKLLMNARDAEVEGQPATAARLHDEALEWVRRLAANDQGAVSEVGALRIELTRIASLSADRATRNQARAVLDESTTRFGGQ